MAIPFVDIPRGNEASKMIDKIFPVCCKRQITGIE